MKIFQVLDTPCSEQSIVSHLVIKAKQYHFLFDYLSNRSISHNSNGSFHCCSAQLAVASCNTNQIQNSLLNIKHIFNVEVNFEKKKLLNW